MHSSTLDRSDWFLPCPSYEQLLTGISFEEAAPAISVIKGLGGSC